MSSTRLDHKSINAGDTVRDRPRETSLEGQAARPAHVDADAWAALLDLVADGEAEVVIKTAKSGSAVIVSESYLEDLRRRAGEGAERTDSSPLSPRELEVLSLAADGHTGVAIADRLGLAVNTVAQHLVSARRKLGVRTTRAAVDLARSSGDLS